MTQNLLKPNRNSLKVLAFLMLIAISGKGMAQSSPLDLKTSIALALSANNSLRADSLGIKEAVYRNKELAGSFLPQVSYSNNAEYNIAIPSQLLPGSVAGQPSKDLVPVQFGTRYSLKSGVEVNQAVFRKDLSIRIKAADLYTGIATTKYTLSREELVYEVATTFYNLQGSYEMVQSTLSDYNNIRDVLQIAKAQYENGVLKKIDYQALQINLANKQSLLDQQQTRYKEQLAYFNYLLGLPVSSETTIVRDYSAVRSLELPQTEIASRTDIKLYHQLIESKLVDLKSTHAEKLPSVNSYFRMSLNSQFNKTVNAFDEGYRYKASQGGISVSMPIFDGNRRKSRLKATEVQLNQLKLETDQLYNQAAMQFAKTSESFANNRTQLSITGQNLELAEEVFRSRKALYKEGVTTLLELLDAERELSQARSNYTQAMIDVQKSWLDVHKSNGSLLTNYINSL